MSPDIIILLLGLVALMALGIPICFAMMSVAFFCLPGDGALFVNGVVIPALSKSAFLISPLRPTGCPKWGWASARNCGRRIAGCDSCPTLVGTISLSILSRGFLKDSEIAEGDGSIWPPPSSFSSVKQRFSC